MEFSFFFFDPSVYSPLIRQLILISLMQFFYIYTLMQTAIQHRFFFFNQRFLRLLQATHWSLVSDGGLDADIQIAVSPLKVREKKLCLNQRSGQEDVRP